MIKHVSVNTNIITVVMGSEKESRTSTGISWKCKIGGNYSALRAAITSTLQRGSNSSALPQPTVIPSDYYLDDIQYVSIVTPGIIGSTEVTGGGGTLQPGYGEIELTFVEKGNLSDGIGSSPGEEPSVCERDDINTQLPLENHPTYSEKLATIVHDQITFYDYLQMWKNAQSVQEKSSILVKLANMSLTTPEYTAFVEVVGKYRKGIESAPFNQPTLTKTSIKVAAPPYGDVNKKVTPTGFGDMMPSGYEWIKTSDRVSRTGRTGSYVHIEQYLGGPTGFFDSDLYPSA